MQPDRVTPDALTVHLGRGREAPHVPSGLVLMERPAPLVVSADLGHVRPCAGVGSTDPSRVRAGLLPHNEPPKRPAHRHDQRVQRRPTLCGIPHIQACRGRQDAIRCLQVWAVEPRQVGHLEAIPRGFVHRIGTVEDRQGEVVGRQGGGNVEGVCFVDGDAVAVVADHGVPSMLITMIPRCLPWRHPGHRAARSHAPQHRGRRRGCRWGWRGTGRAAARGGCRQTRSSPDRSSAAAR